MRLPSAFVDREYGSGDSSFETHFPASSMLILAVAANPGRAAQQNPSSSV
jgi:hypothetical protein